IWGERQPSKPVQQREQFAFERETREAAGRVVDARTYHVVVAIADDDLFAFAHASIGANHRRENARRYGPIALLFATDYEQFYAPACVTLRVQTRREHACVVEHKNISCIQKI